MTEITHTHDDTLITYDENANLWRFTLRGRDRSTDSLAKAKEAIDKPVATKTKPFEKIQVWYVGHNSAPEKVEITGHAERSYGSGTWVWINCDGRRSKERAEYTLYPCSDKNNAIAAVMSSKKSEIEKLEKELSDLKPKLEPLKLEIPE